MDKDKRGKSGRWFDQTKSEDVAVSFLRNREGLGKEGRKSKFSRKKTERDRIGA